MKFVLALAVLAGCAQRVQLEPVTVKPIHIVVDVNMHETPGRPARGLEAK